MAASLERNRLKRHVRSLLTAPHLPAVLPATMVGANWYGGENLMLFLAILFPGLLAIGGALTRTAPEIGSVTDGATNLPLRNKLLQTLDRGFTSEAEFEKTCLVIEVDDFPNLREQLGHDAVEKVLSELGERIRTTLRQTDLVCVLSDGRFGISIDKRQRVDLEATIQLASRLQSAIGEPLSVDQTRVLLSSCIGFVLPSRAPESTGEASLAAAESALGAAQVAGPGSIRAFSNGMAPRSGRANHDNKELEEALEKGQIMPWFQPQISTLTGEITGCEALARWEHPKLGMIAPGAFLPAVAKAGLMERLGEVMLFAGLSALQDWERRGIEVPTVAINISAEELNNPNLFEKIRWELDRFETSPDRLTIEILENVVAQGSDDVSTRNISSLAQLGCKIDLDDFGTGHASISSVRRFDVNRIKIDRSFVTHVDTDVDQQKMVSAILTMAEQLGVDTVAEGVETHSEHAMLAKLGSDHVQGYSIAKPMPHDQFSEWVATYQKRSSPISVIPKLA